VIDIAWAQGAGGISPAVMNILPLVAVFAVFYFLLIRPRQQEEKTHQEMLANLKRNDEVVTGGGLYGKVVALTDDVVTLEVSPKVQVRIARPRISAVVTAQNKEKTKSKDKDKDK
jgi:preprotein translocase subunit YajC